MFGRTASETWLVRSSYAFAASALAAALVTGATVTMAAVGYVGCLLYAVAGGREAATYRPMLAACSCFGTLIASTLV